LSTCANFCAAVMAATLDSMRSAFSDCGCTDGRGRGKNDKKE
jgi:hypothetical protein